ncbi:MAG: DUF1653 domain-containing protein [Candidatus Babeliaceae bacterium]|jgi:hypothetical protein
MKTSFILGCIMLSTSTLVIEKNIPLPEVGAIYKHYKNKLYKVIAVAHHSETLEHYVVYQALYDSEEFGDQAIWIRPLDMFMETITIDGKEILRFSKVI